MDLTQQLAEATAALHDLTVGKAVASITRDGKKVDFRAPDIQALRSYVENLKGQQAGQITRRRGITVTL